MKKDKEKKGKREREREKIKLRFFVLSLIFKSFIQFGKIKINCMIGEKL